MSAVIKDHRKILNDDIRGPVSDYGVSQPNYVEVSLAQTKSDFNEEFKASSLMASVKKYENSLTNPVEDARRAAANESPPMLTLTDLKGYLDKYPVIYVIAGGLILSRYIWKAEHPYAQ